MPDQVLRDGFEGNGKNRVKRNQRRKVGRIAMRPTLIPLLTLL